MKTTLSLAAAVITLGLFTGSANAASARHIDNMADQLQKETAEFLDEIEHHFRHSSSYRHLAHDAQEMMRLAHHIHEVAHHTNARRHIAQDVAEFDKLYHHAQQLVVELDFFTRHSYGHSAYGHYRNPNVLNRQATRHLRRTLNHIDETLHHLFDDLKLERVPVRFEHYSTTYHGKLVMPPRSNIGRRF